MAEICSACGSDRTSSQFDAFECRECGALTAYDGSVRKPGLRWTSKVPDGAAQYAAAAVAAIKEGK